MPEVPSLLTQVKNPCCFVATGNPDEDGEAKVAKEIIEAIDDEKNSTTFRVVEGDLMKLYKNFILVVSANPKEEGSVVHWTLEYEKLGEDVPEPYSLLELCVHLSKDIDSHLVSGA